MAILVIQKDLESKSKRIHRKRGIIREKKIILKRGNTPPFLSKLLPSHHLHAPSNPLPPPHLILPPDPLPFPLLLPITTYSVIPTASPYSPLSLPYIIHLLSYSSSLPPINPPSTPSPFSTLHKSLKKSIIRRQIRHLGYPRDPLLTRLCLAERRMTQEEGEGGRGKKEEEEGEEGKGGRDE